MKVHILTVTDQADFDRVLHMSAHLSEQGAYAYSRDNVLPELTAQVGAEWANKLNATIKSMEVKSL